MYLRDYAQKLKTIAFFSQCIICQQITDNGLCNNCQEALTKEAHASKRQQLIINGQPIIFYALNHFEGLTRRLLFLFKYQNNHIAGNALGLYLATSFKRLHSLADVDYILPLPSHRLRFLVRGFNQAEILAGHLASVYCTVDLHSIKRHKYTKPQAKSSYEQRQRQMHNVFKQKRAITAKHLLIIDDVYTTGATLKALIACIQNFSENHIEKISVLTLCHA
ncbi:ComF family protein [Cysteiniphilum sp. JM-1]|uniref:ComF family protein n=1 Tax=Cysteiniphilum sp. JM-1 TaxID=2610891 RepID=UPI001245FF9A|nr:ComF family protein [Cysteiniphilum sp. JM-1]